MKNTPNRNSFTLIEVLLVMIIMGILAIMMIGNFNTTLKRGRDSQRKNDLSQIQKALELYYEDNRHYPTTADSPTFADIFGKKLCATGAISYTSACATTTYMNKTPNDPSAAYTYKYVPDAIGTYYYLYSFIENTLDQGNGVSITGFSTNAMCNAAGTAKCRYYVGSSNAPIIGP